MPSKKTLQADITNIREKLENKSLAKKKVKQLKKTLTRKTRQLHTLKAQPLQFSMTMKVHEFNEKDTPLEYFSLLRGDKPRYKRSKTHTRKVYTSADPYSEYVENRKASGKTEKRQEYEKKMAAYLQKIEDST